MTMGKSAFHVDDRVGVGLIYSACGVCRFCKQGNENLCVNFRATGRDAHGGYAQFVRVLEDFAFRLPDGLNDAEIAAVLCDGPTGYRALRLAGIKDGDNLGIFGLDNHGLVVLNIARHLYPHSPISVFSTSQQERGTAQEAGAAWTGDTSEEPLARLDAIIDTTRGWKQVLQALENLDHGGRLVIDSNRKDDQDKSQLSNLDYLAHLALEKEIKSVGNISRPDIQAFLEIAPEIPRPQPQVYKLQDANRALVDLKAGSHRGPQVLGIE